MIETYSNFLKTINLTEDQFLKEINSYPVFYCYEDKVEIKTSNIEGVGCFTLYDLKKNEEIGTVLYGNYKNCTAYIPSHIASHLNYVFTRLEA